MVETPDPKADFAANLPRTGPLRNRGKLGFAARPGCDRVGRLGKSRHECRNPEKDIELRETAATPGRGDLPPRFDRMTIPIPDPIPADLAPVFRYWDKKRAGRRMPRRADIDPTELIAFLPALMIIDVVPDDRRYVYRLVGTREVDARGRDPTGHPVGEAFIGSSRERVLENYDRVLLTGRPHVDTGTVITTKDRLDDSHVIFLPLSEDGEAVTQILVYTVFNPAPSEA
jgi:hypothetical protein